MISDKAQAEIQQHTMLAIQSLTNSYFTLAQMKPDTEGNVKLNLSSLMEKDKANLHLLGSVFQQVGMVSLIK